MLLLKLITPKVNIGKIQGFDITKSKSNTTDQWLRCSCGLMKVNTSKITNEDKVRLYGSCLKVTRLDVRIPRPMVEAYVKEMAEKLSKR